MVDMSAQDL